MIHYRDEGGEGGGTGLIIEMQSIFEFILHATLTEQTIYLIILTSSCPRIHASRGRKPKLRPAADGCAEVETDDVLNVRCIGSLTHSLIG